MYRDEKRRDFYSMGLGLGRLEIFIFFIFLGDLFSKFVLLLEDRYKLFRNMFFDNFSLVLVLGVIGIVIVVSLSVRRSLLF